WQTVTAVTDAKWQVTHYVGVSSDITRRKEAEQEIHRLAFYDPLTKLPNRSLLWDRLQQAQSYSARHGTHGALLFIDLDNFKTLNDTQGHHIGDLLLIEVAKRLQEGVRPSDTVARLGGDEFVVVLVDLSDDAQQAASQAQSLGKKLLVTLNQLYQLQEREQYSSASMGITVFRGDEIRITDLLKQADAAMYDAKSAERNALRFFDPAMQVVLEGRAALEADLRQAIPLRQLVLYYQAQVNEAQEMVGAEVLLRWQHPVRGLIPPMDFIPLAEDTGLIVPIGQWVLKEACAQLKVWQADPAMSHLGLSINVGAYQLRQPEFVDQVLGVLETAGVDPRKLTLELTESQMLDHMTVNINKIQELRRAGVRLSLDDFGTGQSSLAHLRYLPLDEIKIDQSFVRGITTDPDPNDTVTVIVQIIIWIAESLGLDLIAEGVETEQQHDFLRRNGCHRYQGYLFGKPVPITEFQNRVRTDPRLQGDGTSEAAP
ncbi:MAG: putative bifunctional diguanylate cyclase/phosphodiesterase, partial [Acidiferrobacterales bacterium]